MCECNCPLRVQWSSLVRCLKKNEKDRQKQTKRIEKREKQSNSPTICNVEYRLYGTGVIVRCRRCRCTLTYKSCIMNLLMLLLNMSSQSAANSYSVTRWIMSIFGIVLDYSLLPAISNISSLIRYVDKYIKVRILFFFFGWCCKWFSFLARIWSKF